MAKALTPDTAQPDQIRLPKVIDFLTDAEGNAPLLAKTPVRHTGYAAQVREATTHEPEHVKPKSMEELTREYGELARGAAEGAVSSVPGLPGDVESIGRLALSPLGVSQETVLPTTGDIEEKVFGPAESRERAFGRAVGPFATPLGVRGAGRLADLIGPHMDEALAHVFPPGELVPATAHGRLEKLTSLHMDAPRPSGKGIINQTPKEAETLENYLGDPNLNSSLRDASDLSARQQEEIAHLDSLMKNQSDHPEFYRLIHDQHPESDKLDALGIGDTYRDPGYMSTTHSEKALKDVLIPGLEEFGANPSHVMVIENPGSLKGIDPSEHVKGHVFSNQKEVILPRGLDLIKTSERMEDGTKYHTFKLASQYPDVEKPVRIPQPTKDEQAALDKALRSPRNRAIHNEDNWNEDGTPATKMAEDAITPEIVELSKIKATQDSVDPKIVKSWKNYFDNHGIPDTMEGRPLVHEVNGVYYVRDGHHRVHAAMENGEKSMPVSVLHLGEDQAPLALTGPEQATVSWYKNTGSSHINDVLRRGVVDSASDSTKKNISTLDSLISRSPLPQDAIFHRVMTGGKRLDSFFKEGAQLGEKSFLSVSKTPGGAMRAADPGRKDIVWRMKIEVPGGTNAFNVEANRVGPSIVHGMGDEGEFLLGRDTRMVVTKVDPENRTAELRIVKPNEGLINSTPKAVKENQFPFKHDSYGDPRWTAQGKDAPKTSDSQWVSMPVATERERKDITRLIKTDMPKETRPIELSKLIADQKSVETSRVQAFMKDKNVLNEPVQVVKYGGEYYLRGGHHRVEAAKAKGLKTLPAKIRDLGSRED